MKATILLLAILAGALPASQDPATSIGGTIKLKGIMLKLKPYKITCPNCSQLYPDGMPREDLVRDKENRVQWAFVYIKAGLEGKKFDVPKTPVMIEEKDCRYAPHMVGIMVGQDVVIRNSDPHAHCAHIIPFDNKEAQAHHAKPGMETKKKFERPEVMIKIKDDASTWMNAWVGVLDHPYFAVSGPDGRYDIKGIPPGKYTIEVWHEMYKSVTQEIELKEGDKKAVDLTLEIKKE
jgi:hypothetical protein